MEKGNVCLWAFRPCGFVAMATKHLASATAEKPAFQWANSYFNRELNWLPAISVSAGRQEAGSLDGLVEQGLMRTPRGTHSLPKRGKDWFFSLESSLTHYRGKLATQAGGNPMGVVCVSLQTRAEKLN